jgi:hypothetical protein
MFAPRSPKELEAGCATHGHAPFNERTRQLLADKPGAPQLPLGAVRASVRVPSLVGDARNGHYARVKDAPIGWAMVIAVFVGVSAGRSFESLWAGVGFAAAALAATLVMFWFKARNMDDGA